MSGGFTVADVFRFSSVAFWYKRVLGLENEVGMDGLGSKSAFNDEDFQEDLRFGEPPMLSALVGKPLALCYLERNLTKVPSTSIALQTCYIQE